MRIGAVVYAVGHKVAVAFYLEGFSGLGLGQAGLCPGGGDVQAVEVELGQKVFAPGTASTTPTQVMTPLALTLDEPGLPAFRETRRISGFAPMA